MITKKVEKIVHEVCKSDKNIHGYTAWTHHISVVRDLALKLAEKFNADKEIVELAALLHDIGSVSKAEWLEEHNIHGAKRAKEILEELHFPKDKIEKVVHCVYAHRASRDIPRETIEAEIIASADAMSHIEMVYQLLHHAYISRKMEVEEGREWVLRKIKKSWNKLMPAGQEMMREKYEASLIVLKNI